MKGIEFLHNGSNNIEAAGTAIHTENNTIAYAVKYTAENRRQHNIIQGSISIKKSGGIQTKGKYRRTNDNINGIFPPH